MFARRALALPSHSAYGLTSIWFLLSPAFFLSHMSPPAPPASLFAIYRLCFIVGLFSFGGGLTAWFHREVVKVRGWMTDDEFFSGYSLAQILPGVNSTNMAVYIGQHLLGALGAIAALLGLLTGPFAIVIAAASVYQQLA